MDANWIWVALIAFLVFCCLPMLLMGRHDKHTDRTNRSNPEDKPSDGRNRSS
ncbi:MAG: hypothetical protein AB7I50_05690 [Vicinamibacterales bacterium]